MPPRYSIEDVKAAARGQWLRIFRDLAGYDIQDTGNRETPCPKCGGQTRFRVLDADEGALFCSRCFNKKNGDGLSAYCWLTDKPASGVDFKAVVQEIGEFLGVKPSTTRGKEKKSEKKRVFFTIEGVTRFFIDSLAKKVGPGVKLTRSWGYEGFSVLRFDLPTPAGEKQRKEFRPVSRVPLGTEGKIGWASAYPAGLRPLYRRAELQAAAADLLTIQAGEKAADAAAGLGLVATTNAGGEQAIDKTDWAPAARFTVGAIVADNDQAGESFATTLAGRLRRIRPDLDCRIIRLPGLPPKGDIVEWIAAGGTRQAFLDLVAATAPAAGEIVEAVPEADDDPHRLARVNLERLTGEVGQTIRFWRDQWYSWEDGSYREMTERELRAILAQSVRKQFEAVAQEKILESAGRESGKPITVQKVTTGCISNVLQATSGLCHVPSSIELGTWLPAREAKQWIAMQNGILDLESYLRGEDATQYLKALSPEWFSQVCLPYAFEASTYCPQWIAFLENNLEMDPERIKVLQEWAGYLLLPNSGQQKFMVLEGNGANGKSVYIAAITAMLGEVNVSNVQLEIFGDRFSRTETLGKLLNAASDCGEIDKISEGYIKSFTSGDRMFFDRKLKGGLNCKPTARLMIGCNNKPRFSDKTDGVWRRVLMIPWRVQIADERKILGMDTVAYWQASGELAGILNWAIQGLVRLRAQGRFTDCQAMKDSIEDYKSEVNPAREFLKTYCKVLDFGQIGCSDLYSAYAKWSVKHGYTHPYGDRTFGKEVKRAFPEVSRKRGSELGRAWYYDRLGLDDGF